MIPLSHIPERGTEIRICWSALPRLKKPAFVGHARWTVLGYDARKGVQTKIGFFKSWVRVYPTDTP